MNNNQNIMSDLSIVVCNHDTPDLIKNLVTSIKNVSITVPEILVIETGDSKKKLGWEDMIQGGVSYHRYYNQSHGNGVNRSFDLVRTRYMLLVDSDVLLLDDIEKPFNLFKDGGFTLMGEVVGDRGGKSLYPRVNPWFCFMDLEQLKKHGIKFYDKERTDKSKKSGRVYDIGSTMFEDVVNADLMVANVKLENKYFKHYEGMSWRVQKYNPDNGDTDIDNGGTHDNKALYEYGLKVQEQYRKDVSSL